MLLVYVGELDGLAHLKGTTVDLLQPHDKTEEGGLAGAVGADDAHDAVRRQHEVEVGEEHLVAKGLADVLCLDDLVAEAGSVGDEDFEFLLALLLLFAQHLLVGVETGLTLGLTRLRSHVCPFELALESLASLGGLLLFLHHTLGLLVEP